MTGRRGGHFGTMVLFSCLLVCRFAWGGDPTDSDTLLKARFVPGSAPVGSRVELILAYRLPEGARLPEAPRIQGLDGLPVEGVEKGTGEFRIGLLVDRLSDFKTGPLTLSYLTREGKTASLEADPVGLTVLSNLGDRPEEAQLKPIRGIIPTRSGLMTNLTWVLGALAVCAAALGGFLWIRRRPVARTQRTNGVPPPALAEKEIHDLVSQGLFEKGRVKEFYFRFSEILRRYMESLRGFPAAEYTTQEIALAIQAPEDRQILPLLQEADLVKFADLRPTPAKKGDDLELALGYIRETGQVFVQRMEDNAPQEHGIVPRWRQRMRRGMAGP